jgi:predicted acetyltransferase
MTSIRKAKRGEMDQVFEFFLDYVRYERSLGANKGYLKPTTHRRKYRDFFDKLVGAEGSRVYVTDDNGAVGFICGRIHEQDPVFMKSKMGYMQGLWVEEDHRGNGYGGRMVDKLINWFKENGVERIECTVSIGNFASKKIVGDRDFQIYQEKLYLEL